MRPCSPLHLTPLALSLACLAAQAQTTPPPKAAATVECPADRPDDCKARKEEDRGVRNNDAGSPQVAGDAPVPAAGGGGQNLSERFDRGPLKVRNFGLSLGVDHLLSRQWSVGGLLNVATGRVERSQTETITDLDNPGNPPNVLQSDNKVDTRSTTLAASLTYFTDNAVAYDGVLSVTRTRLETQRLTGTDEFSGENLSRSWGLWLGASRIWRFGPRAVVPQLAVEYIDTHTDALHATDVKQPTAGFDVSEHRQRRLAGLLGAQVQQPMNTSFGTLMPYARISWRQRLWKSADRVTSTSTQNLVRELDPEAAESRSAFTLAGGVVAQFTRGISSFVDLSYRRGSNDLRETRLGLGLKFEI